MKEEAIKFQRDVNKIKQEEKLENISRLKKISVNPLIKGLRFSKNKNISGFQER